MKTTPPSLAGQLRLVVALAVLSLTCAAGQAASAPSDFKQCLGLQLWSLRAQAKLNPLAALDLVRNYDLGDVEIVGTGGLKPAAYADALRQRGLRGVSAFMGYERLKKDIAGAIAEAKTLGVQYLIVPTLAHQDGVFDAEAVAADFNAWGEACQAAGLRFGYHPHGFEFRPMADGRTRFDVLMALTQPEKVCFEMDVFWVTHAGIDPVALLRKYAGRWLLMHVKDLRKGVVTGSHTGRAPATDHVPVGQGQVDWPAVLGAAQEVGVRHYFIEDETTAPLESIAATLDYLRSLKL